MQRLQNRVQPYAWGTTDRIAELLGREADGTPAAELWIGAHPAAPSQVLDADGTPGATLEEVVAGDPAQTLGPDRDADRLPFLLKVLSAAAPLSLQVHPDRERAGRRFAEEDAAGVPLDAPHRLYRDTEHKPELLFALEEFHAMAGFRSPGAARDLLADLHLTDLPPAATDLFAQLLADLSLVEEGAALRAATQRVLTAPAEAVGPLVDAVARACAELEDVTVDGSARILADLARHYPGDPGVLVSAWLNKVHLQAGETLFLPAGNVHAYLSGTGVELMASSDNVLRGGLTPKHVDVAELLEVVDFRVLPAPLLPAHHVSADEAVFDPGVGDFALTVLQVRDGSLTTWQKPRPRTLLCLQGSVRIVAGEQELVLGRGETAFVGAGDHPLVVTGAGVLAAAAPGQSWGR
ncbi:mannose-6-phosphate isomerase, class I [Kineococcus gynurae]|uniref:mannose-6-phosphate isomerase n=1 Tax=Kineococcus gynurae TaxID=452979 RepID=A0ABV5LRE6_9ACTN